MQYQSNYAKKNFRLYAEVLAAIPGIGSGIFSLEKWQLLLLWNSKDQIQALAEMHQRSINATITPDRLKRLALEITGSEEEADSVKCNYYHANYQSSNQYG